MQFKTSLLALAVAVSAPSCSAALGSSAAAPRVGDDSRSLLGGSGLRGARQLDWFKDVTKAVVNLGKDVTKTSNDYVVIGGETLADGAIGVTQETVNFCARTVDMFAGTSPLLRDDKLWEKLTSSPGETAWTALIHGTQTVDDYVEHHLVSDLEWLGDQLGKFLCDTPGIQTAEVILCSTALNAAACAATDGMAPHCANTVDQALVTTLLSTIKETAFDMVVSCAVYHVLKRTGMCGGIAYSLGYQLATNLMDDPYSSICTVAVSCSCDSDKCLFSCGYPVPAYCDAQGFQDDAKAIGDAITSVAKASLPPTTRQPTIPPSAAYNVPTSKSGGHF